MKFIVLALLLTAIAVESYFPTKIPGYCNWSPEAAQIPALTNAEILSNDIDSLKQVVVMIRHGSRTPWGANSCWSGYENDISWSDCNVTELMLSSPAQYPYDSEVMPEPWLFRKVYDAFTNELGGTNCMTGQLLKEGYEQEAANGKILKNAYLDNPNPKFNMFESDLWHSINTEQIYFRSDDEQRTLMSGQILVSSLFNITSPISIPTWHTGDDQIDQIAPNANACPRLNQASAAAYSSPDFIAENTSAAMNQLSVELDNIMGAGYWQWYTSLDCLMTAVCTNHSIPANAQTGAEFTDLTFNQTISQAEYSYAYQALHNNSFYSKIGMGQTIYDMRTRIQAAVDGDSSALKFALWSAHDTSIMPFLAALLGDSWDRKWARYAALVSIEIYNSTVVGSDDMFRMVYNGEPLLFPGCTTTICDVSVLLGSMSFAQETMPDCAAESEDSPGTAGNSNLGTKKTLDSDSWILVCFASVILGISIGGFISWFYLKRKFSSETENRTVLMGLQGDSNDNKNPLL